MSQMKQADAAIEQSDYQSRQLTAALASLSLIYTRYPEIPKAFTSYERDNAPPLYGMCDATKTMHWTFTNPQSMGS